MTETTKPESPDEIGGQVERVVRCEWGFSEPPEEVDLRRLWNEAKSASGIMFYSYMEQLYKHAPKTYERLRDWRMSQGCTLVNWGYDPHGRFTPNAALSGWPGKDETETEK